MSVAVVYLFALPNQLFLLWSLEVAPLPIVGESFDYPVIVAT